MIDIQILRNAVDSDPFARSMEECFSCEGYGRVEDRALSRTHEARWSSCPECEGLGFLVIFDDGMGTFLNLLEDVSV